MPSERSEDERQARKFFQNYLTTMLYKQTGSLVEEKAINKYIHEACAHLWKRFIFGAYNNGLDTTPVQDATFGWNHLARLYLKGGKSTLAFLKKMLKINENNISNNIARVFYNQIATDTNDSDYDFNVILHHTQMEYLDDYYMLVQQIMLECLCFLKQKIHESPQDNEESDLNKLLRHINSHYYQHKVMLELFEKDNIMNEFNPDEQLILQEFQHYCQEHDATSGVPGFFQFKLSNIPIQFKSSKVDISTDNFHLFRIFIQFELVRPEHASTFELTKDKYFAECIDVSLSTKADINQDLWTKTDLEHILHSVYPFDQSPHFLYPVVGLDYQLKDLIHIIEEPNPSKPDKRCKRFIEQLYFSCIDQKLPALPTTIYIGEAVHDEMMNEESRNCKLFNDVLDFVQEIREHGQVLYHYKPKPFLQSLHNFELWCKTQTVYNLSFESSCNENFISREVLINQILHLTTYAQIDTLNKLSKRVLCITYKDLVIINTVLQIWTRNAVQQLLHNVDSIASLESSDALMNNNLSVQQYIEFLAPAIHDSDDMLEVVKIVNIKIRSFFRQRAETIEYGSDMLKKYVADGCEGELRSNFENNAHIGFTFVRLLRKITYH